MLALLKQKIKNHFIHNNTLPDLVQSLTRLKTLGYTPANILDIGAYHGQFAQTAMRIWGNNTPIYCFEGNPAKKQTLENTFAHHKNVSIFATLLGEKNDNVLFNINETASSVLPEHTPGNFRQHTVPMQRLDTLIASNTLPQPDFVKIDTQGYEYHILTGMGQYLTHVKAILLETNLLDIHQNVHLVSDIVQLLDQHGFAMYDITEMHRRPLDNALFQVDFIFVPKQSPLRANKRWK